MSNEYLDIAMKKVIKQEINAVLDNIKKEIEQNAYPIVHGVNNHEKGMTLFGIFQIIDKYNAESEVSNADNN